MLCPTEIITYILLSIHMSAQVPENEKDLLEQLLSDTEILEALKSSSQGKAAGLNRLLYKFWKELYDQYLKQEEGDDKANVVEILRMAFNDIKLYGVESETHFCDGWICLLFKKKEKRNIANYQPITLLNRLQNHDQSTINLTGYHSTKAYTQKSSRLCIRQKHL